MATLFLIAHAVTDENRNTSYGHHGDQSGWELNGCQWYDYPWTHMFRPVDAQKAEGMALFMEKAVTNGFIGYNQAQRGTLLARLKEIDFQVEELNVNAAADCSMLVYVAIKSQFRDIEYSGVTANGTPLSAPKTSGYVAFMEEYLPDDFTIHTEESYLRSSENLLRGDILLADGHVAMWI